MTLSALSARSFIQSRSDFSAFLHPSSQRVKVCAMEKVTGIGGLFFRSKNPQVLGQWYAAHLGITLSPQSYDEPSWRQESGPTVFAPFPEATKKFGDPSQTWMVNFRVRNLDAIAAQLRAA